MSTRGNRVGALPPITLRAPEWRFTACVVLSLVAVNTLWYAAFRDWNVSHPVFLVVASFGFFALLRAMMGIGWRDLSSQTRLVVVSGVALLCLLFIATRGWGARDAALALLPVGPYPKLQHFFFFAACCVLLRTVIPLALVRWRFGQRPRDFGYRLPGTWTLAVIYVGLLVVVLPSVYWASSLPEFQRAYPQGDVIVAGTVPWLPFVAYQLAYFFVFLSGESFWRGYLIFGVERDLGWLALPFMVVVYSISHYGKPMLETNAAILTGFVLGYLALRHRSFWLGVALHWTVAFAMDVFAIWARGIRFG
jgi:membrane protease YdiL (CAAX protease family)